MHSVDLLIFDLDGTLIDSKEDIATAVNLTLADIGLPPKTMETIAKFIGGGVRGLLKQALNSDTHPPLDEVLPIFRKHYLNHLLDRTTLYPGVRETLEYFRNKHLAVVTNKPIDYTTPILNGLGITDYFRVILGGDSTPNPKPHPEMILKTMEALGSGKKETVMIGDGINDILAARAAEIPCCAVTYGLTERTLLLREQPDFLCDSPGGIRDLFG